MANIVQFENVGLRYGEGPETLCDVSFSLAVGLSYFLTVFGAALGRVL